MKNQDELFSLPIPEIIKYLKQASISELQEILKNKEAILALPNHIFNIFALNVPTEIKIQLFHDPIYFDKIKKIGKNRHNKTYFEFLSEEEKIAYLKNIKEDELSYYLSLLNQTELKHLSQNNLVASSNDQLLNQLQNKWQFTDSIKQNIKSLIEQKKRNIFYYMKIKNKNEFQLYHKFGLLIKAQEYDNLNNLICLDDQTILSMDYLNQINTKHMNLLIQKMQSIDPNEQNTTKLFLSCLKLYEIFGFDNAMKILNQKFTYMTISAYKKFAEIEFVDIRREYRLQNQEKFYSYELLQKIKQALKSNNYYYLQNICKTNDPKYLQSFFEIIKNQKEETMIQMIQEEIKEREEILKNQFIEKYVTLHTSNKKRGNPLTCDDIYRKIKDCTYQPILNDKGQVEKNLELNKFLLGNEKADNDCLFRLIMNQKAFGLNQNFSRIINSFDTIKKITQRKDNTLSMYSILDVIDICKSILYKLAPNEQDMTLETVTKILNASQFCSESNQQILKRAKKLHVARKKKYYSSIPTVEGITNQKIRYQVLNFDYEKLITAGIDTGNCLRVGGHGEDFLQYCMTNPHAVIIGLWDAQNKFYICPFIRNGNGIYGNGIDPKVENQELLEDLLEALQICTNRIMKKSVESEKIEFASLTDLNQKEFFKQSGLSTVSIDHYLPLDQKFYSDYHKKEITNYIIVNSPSYQGPKLYYPEKKYYQNRTLNYIYDSKTDKDKKKIEQIMNAIKYEHIELRNQLHKNQKYSAKRKFIPMNIDDYEYVVGNKDWLIAIDYCNTIESYCIPYDPRATEEYQEALKELGERYNIHLGGKTL